MPELIISCSRHGNASAANQFSTVQLSTDHSKATHRQRRNAPQGTSSLFNSSPAIPNNALLLGLAQFIGSTAMYLFADQLNSFLWQRIVPIQCATAQATPSTAAQCNAHPRGSLLINAAHRQQYGSRHSGADDLIGNNYQAQQVI
jgi:hypothetical protein